MVAGRRGRWLLVGITLILIAGFFWWSSLNGVTPLVMVNRLIDFLRYNPYSPLLFIIVYVARPLILFPASLLTIAAGVLFGAVGGTVYTLIGSNLSALLAYIIGRQLRDTQTLPDDAHYHEPASSSQQNRSQQVIAPYIARMQSNPFTTILTMHCLMMPYDLVNYGAGTLGIHWRSFTLATLLGSVPGTIVFVLAGASIQGYTITGVPRFNPTTLAASGVILAGSLLLSRYLSKQNS
ncbi:MAG: VTT domain-containing protein [Chloroflexota bacterium]